MTDSGQLIGLTAAPRRTPELHCLEQWAGQGTWTLLLTSGAQL